MNPYGLICGGLLVLNKVACQQFLANVDKIAFDENGRTEDINETLNVLFMAIHRIRLTSEAPAGLPPSQLESVHSAALELCTAIMDYPAIVIKLLSKRVFGMSFSNRNNSSEHHFQNSAREPSL